MSSITSFSSKNLQSTLNSSLPASSSSSSIPHRQFNPFSLHQQRQFQDQQENFLKSPPNDNDATADSADNPLYENLDEANDVLDDMDSYGFSPRSSSSMLSTTQSPINYFFNRPAAAIISEDSLQLLEKRNGGVAGVTNVTEYNSNYFFLSGLASEATGLDREEFTTLLPENFGDITASNNSTSIALLENWWDVFADEQYLRHSLGWTVTLVVAYILILVIGIVGNSMVILVVIFRPQMRSVTNLFIMCLATADLLVILFCVPATLLANVFTPWILGSFMCKGVAYVQGVSVCASAYSLAAISLDRCKAIYRPMERPRGLSKSQALLTICLIWIIALLLTIPWAVIFNVVISDKDGLSYCIETWKNEQHGKIYFLVANLICCYCLPLILISISNIVIWCNVVRRKVPQDSASIGTIKRMHRQTRHGVRKMLGIVTLAFLVSWLPLYILVTRVKFSKNIGEAEQSLLEILLPLAQWLGSWNSSINPVLYAFLNSKFREMFKSLLPAWVPFVHKSSSNLRIARNNVGRGTVTNGTFTVGTTGTPSFSTVFTARSSGRSCRSNNSRRFHHHKSYYNNHRTLLVSSFRGDENNPNNATARTTSVPTAATTTTVAALVGATSSRGGSNGTGGGNRTSSITTTTMAVATTTATITAL